MPASYWMMVARLLLSILPIVLAGAFASPAAAGPCRVDNLMPGYDAFLARTAGATPEQRAHAFLWTYAPQHPDFYLLGGVTSLAALRTPAIAYFSGGTSRPGLRPFSDAALASTEQAVAQDFDAIEARFTAALPDFQCRTRIVFGVSLGRFDGTLVPGNPPRLQFGLDLIARIHTTETLPALFHHELFHLYQAEKNPAGAAIDPIPVWWGMWQEGLATWFSGTLNPSLPLEKLFWLPRDLVPRAEAQRPQIAAALLRDIDASGDAYDRYFTANTDYAGLPPRSGYYLGYLLAAEQGRTHSAAELARMPPAQARVLVQAFLAREAATP